MQITFLWDLTMSTIEELHRGCHSYQVTTHVLYIADAEAVVALCVTAAVSLQDAG